MDRLRFRPLTRDEVDFTLTTLGGNDLRGAVVDPSLWTTASLTRSRIDVEQGPAYAVAHGLRLDAGR